MIGEGVESTSADAWGSETRWIVVLITVIVRAAPVGVIVGIEVVIFSGERLRL